MQSFIPCSERWGHKRTGMSAAAVEQKRSAGIVIESEEGIGFISRLLS